METTSARERAVELAELAADKLVAARSSLSDAMSAARTTQGLLLQAEGELASLPMQARTILGDQDAKRYVANAQTSAKDIDARLEDAQSYLDELGDHFADAEGAVNAGKDALAELDELAPELDAEADSRGSSHDSEHDPAWEQRGGYRPTPPTTEQVRTRLERLDTLVQGLSGEFDLASQRLETAREHIKPMLESSREADDLRRSVAKFAGTGAAVRDEVRVAEDGLLEQAIPFSDAREDGHRAARSAHNLAIHARAAANPTEWSHSRLLQETSDSAFEDRTQGRLQNRLGPPGRNGGRE